MTRRGWIWAAAAAAAAACGAEAFADGDAAAESDLAAAVPSTVFSGDPVSNFYDDVQEWKSENCLPIGVGAWHWWHMNRKSHHDFGYGIPGLRGTYYWYVTADPQVDLGDGVTSGAHVDFRLRDSDDDRFRAFFDSTTWLWEAYGWLRLQDDVTLKAGKIWRRFGLDWDGSWYGNVPYFDGWKLDPDWGGALETKFDVADGVRADAFLQAFFAEDHVNGSIPGADSESADGNFERWSAVARVVPTWTCSHGATIALGLSATTGRVERRGDSSETVSAGAVDLTVTHGPLKLFAEAMESTGERNPVNYVTGGPSDRSHDWLAGAAYTVGPATLRGSVSHGRYDDPSGEQVFYLVGATVAVTKNVDLYLEYVRWDVRSESGPRSKFEDGFQFVLNWRF